MYPGGLSVHFEQYELGTGTAAAAQRVHIPWSRLGPYLQPGSLLSQVASGQVEPLDIPEAPAGIWDHDYQALFEVEPFPVGSLAVTAWGLGDVLKVGMNPDEAAASGMVSAPSWEFSDHRCGFGRPVGEDGVWVLYGRMGDRDVLTRIYIDRATSGRVMGLVSAQRKPNC